MLHFADSTFEDSNIAIDGARYTNCTFTRCEIIYNGGIVQLAGNVFDGCHFRFGGGAQATIAFMQGCAQDPGLALMVERATGFRLVGPKPKGPTIN